MREARDPKRSAERGRDSVTKGRCWHGSNRFVFRLRQKGWLCLLRPPMSLKFGASQWSRTPGLAWLLAERTFVFLVFVARTSKWGQGRGTPSCLGRAIDMHLTFLWEHSASYKYGCPQTATSEDLNLNHKTDILDSQHGASEVQNCHQEPQIASASFVPCTKKSSCCKTSVIMHRRTCKSKSRTLKPQNPKPNKP